MHIKRSTKFLCVSIIYLKIFLLIFEILVGFGCRSMDRWQRFAKLFGTFRRGAGKGLFGSTWCITLSMSSPCPGYCVSSGCMRWLCRIGQCCLRISKSTYDRTESRKSIVGSIGGCRISITRTRSAVPSGSLGRTTRGLLPGTFGKIRENFNREANDGAFYPLGRCRSPVESRCRSSSIRWSDSVTFGSRFGIFEISLRIATLEG